MSGIFARLFSSRVRHLEKVNDDLRAMFDDDFDKVSMTRMTYDEKTGFEGCFKGSFAQILAAWAFNTLEACGAKNYVELGVVHPDGGLLNITVQKVLGESPGAKAARLEKELEELRRTLTEQGSPHPTPSHELNLTVEP